MYPITYEADLNPTPSRATTFFRLLLAIPWLVVATFWGILFVFTHLFAWIAIIVLGRYPEWLYNFNAGVVRFSIRVTAWLYLQTDEWPPFGFSDDPSYPIRVNVPAAPEERQSRLKALFRFLLVLPVAIILSYGTTYIQLLAGLVAWLVIVFRGYLPEGLFNMMSFINGFHTRVLAYIVFLTDAYPPVGIEKGKGGGGGGGVVQPAAPAPVV
jgi:Domain of unknown function (DUF4389)